MENYDAGKEIEEEVDYNFDEQEEEDLGGTGDDGRTLVRDSGMRPLYREKSSCKGALSCCRAPLT